MLNPILPENEEDRLKALHELLILDTEPEQRFDRVTHYAAMLFKVPIVLVSLVDANRQWFKSKQGLAASETPRNLSFCAHAILEDDILVINDTLTDPRFCDNPLVSSDPKIRFYAGAQLHMKNGMSVGTLCIIDRVPRQIDAEELTQLKELATVVARELQGMEATTSFFAALNTTSTDKPCCHGNA